MVKVAVQQDQVFDFICIDPPGVNLLKVLRQGMAHTCIDENRRVNSLHQIHT